MRTDAFVRTNRLQTTARERQQKHPPPPTNRARRASQTAAGWIAAHCSIVRAQRRRLIPAQVVARRYAA